MSYYSTDKRCTCGYLAAPQLSPLWHNGLIKAFWATSIVWDFLFIITGNITPTWSFTKHAKVGLYPHFVWPVCFPGYKFCKKSDFLAIGYRFVLSLFKQSSINISVWLLGLDLWAFLPSTPCVCGVKLMSSGFPSVLRPSEYTKGGLNWTGTPAWTSQLSSSNWCHMIQKGHVTPTATSYHPLTKAERFCRKFGIFFQYYWLCVECFVRNYVSRVQKHSLPKMKMFMMPGGRYDFYNVTVSM